MRKTPAQAARCWDLVKTSIGEYGLVTGEKGLVEILSHPSGIAVLDRVKSRYPEICREKDTVIEEAVRQLEEYFAGCRRTFTLRLDFHGMSSFAIEVLKHLERVPFGRTVTYGHLALLAGRPRAARAVGRIMAANPFPLVIPCHRVIGTNGGLTGYSGGKGIETKEWLLQFEKNVMGEG